MLLKFEENRGIELQSVPGMMLKPHFGTLEKLFNFPISMLAQLKNPHGWQTGYGFKVAPSLILCKPPGFSMPPVLSEKYLLLKK